MATSVKAASYFPERINMHVASMQYHSDVDMSGQVQVHIPAPVTLDADGILDGHSIATAGSTTTFNVLYVEDDDDEVHVMSRFGRNVTVVASGAATSTVTVHGRDYLNQPMSETLTLNGTTPVTGAKCFKWIDEVEYGATGGTTIDLGWGSRLGVPFKALKLISELETEAAPAAGALTNGVITATTQTATTADPRGYYTPHASHVPNGARYYDLVLLVDRDNLHGNAHFFSG